jgi:transcriptional regulator with XRE-family HTH domain
MVQAGYTTALTRRLGQRLAAERYARRLTQRDVGEMMGIAQSAVYRIEAGIFARFITAMEYAEVMGYEIDFHLVPLPLEGDE